VGAREHGNRITWSDLDKGARIGKGSHLQLPLSRTLAHMATRLISVVVDSADPARLARFWAAALGWRITVEEPDEVAVETVQEVEWGDGGLPCLVFVPVTDPKTTKNRVHLDLVSTSPRRQRDSVDQLVGLDARPVDIGQGDVPWVVLADPEGNELCVLEPREDYGHARGIAAVVLDCPDPQALAPFWSSATGWQVADASPQAVTLRHPHTQAATRLELLAVIDPKVGKNRVHLDVAPRPGDAPDEDVARLEAAGARRIDIGQGDVSWVVLADPEGNELCVLTPR
jgi:hypothetical protein